LKVSFRGRKPALRPLVVPKPWTLYIDLMADADFTLMLEILKNLQAGQARIENRLEDLTQRVSSMEHKLASFHGDLATLHGDLANVHQRIDHVEQRLGRIERRLDLVEA
jgi:chromosome segregation ATPase